MAKKMWAGRFSKELSSKVNDFNSSLSFDYRMFKNDIEGSKAHAKMLAKCGIIGEKDGQEIIAGLDKILAGLQDGSIEFPDGAEDIHMAVEEILTGMLPREGKMLHTARSRNDQVAVDLRLYLRDEMGEIDALLRKLIKAIAALAKNNIDAVMPGYTHLQRAQPVSFAHYILAYGFMFKRDIARLGNCRELMNTSPLGCGALATSTFPIDRDYTAELLGFSGPCENSIDGVSDRDYAIELAGVISIIMMHLSRFSEEIILWCSGEFNFIELDDAYSTGSSIMPQKKNPDIAELVRGKTGRVYGNLTALLTVMKGIPLAYNKDMQEDKEAIFDSVDNVKLCLDVFADMLLEIKVNKARLRQAAASGYINATDCADFLVKKGMSFRDAYKITGELVALCIEKETTLEKLPLADYRAKSELFDDGIYDAVDLITCLNGRKVKGGPSAQSVKNQIAILEKI